MQIMMSDKAYISDMVSDDIYHSLETISFGDGVRLSPKALLFNRYAHWHSYFTAEGFKMWYLETYLGREAKV